jgi:hypothetical protein
MRLKHISLHKPKDIPDHVLEEIKDVAIEMGKLIHPILHTKHPNLCLAAFAWLHAVTIRELVSDDPEQVRKCAVLECKALLSNIEFLLSVDSEMKGGKHDD